MTDRPTERVVQLNRGVEQGDSQGAARGPQHEALQRWIGRWINRGHTINDDGSPGLTITTSGDYTSHLFDSAGTLSSAGSSRTAIRGRTTATPRA